MTTTSNNCGLADNERSSSRVVRPPGGVSSDIFGAAAADAGTPHTGKRQHSSSQNTSSNIFGDNGDKTSERNSEGNDVFSGEPHKLAGKGRNQSRFNPITGEPYDESGKPCVDADTSSAARQPPKAVQSPFHYGSDETGSPTVGHGDESHLHAAVGKAQPQVHTSSRVTHPPGGQSHPLW